MWVRYNTPTKQYQYTLDNGQNWNLLEFDANVITQGTLGINRVPSIPYSKLSLSDGDVPWAKVSKSGSSLADLATRAIANLSDGANVAKLDAANAFSNTGCHSFAGLTQFKASTPSAPASGKGLEIFYDGGAPDCGFVQAYDRTGAAYKPITYYGAGHRFYGGGLGIGSSLFQSDGQGLPALVVANPSNSSQYVNIGYDNTGQYGFITSVHTGVAWKPLKIQNVSGLLYLGSSGGGVDIVGAIRERGRSVALGEWTSTWDNAWLTTPQGSLSSIGAYIYGFTKIGKTILLQAWVTFTITGGTYYVNLRIPEGLTLQKTMAAPLMFQNNGGSAWVVGNVYQWAGQTYLYISTGISTTVWNAACGFMLNVSFEAA